MHASDVNSDHATELQKLQAELCDAKAQLSDSSESKEAVINCIASSSWLLWKRRGMPFGAGRLIA